MSDFHAPTNFGRVDDDGTVYVKVGDAERSVGQVPDATAEEAMAFFTRRYDSLVTEVNVLATRIESQTMSPEEARKAIASMKQNVAEANAVGDLEALTKRLEALEALLPAQIEALKAAKAEQVARAIAAKQEMVAEAEKLAASNDWRGGVERFHGLLEEWKKLPRADRATDDELWHQFSSARTTYTRRRKQHYTALHARREEAKKLKEQIIAEAEPLATSTDWGPTSAAFRDLMARWKAAGGARRSEDDALWARFRAIQDQFFDARTEAQRAADSELSGNLEAKNELLDQVEKDLADVSDVERAKSIYRTFLGKFGEIGHVPRSAMRAVDARVRAIGDRVNRMEEEEWQRTDPEARKRAEDTVALFSSQVSKLEADLAAAEKAGQQSKVKELTKSLETYNAWLEQAKETLSEFEN